MLITHDAPDGVPLVGDFRLDDYTETMCQESRVRLARAAANTSPKLLLHGHWHRRYSHDLARIDREASEEQGTVIWTTTRVKGLASDIEGDGRSWAVLDHARSRPARSRPGAARGG